MKIHLIGTLTLLVATGALVQSSSALDRSYPGGGASNPIKFVGWGDKGYGESGSSGGGGYGGGEDSGGGWSDDQPKKKPKSYDDDDGAYQPKKTPKSYGDEDEYKPKKRKSKSYGHDDGYGGKPKGGSGGSSGSSGGSSSSDGSGGNSKPDNSACLARCKEDCRQDAIANHKFQIDPTCVKNCNPRCAN